MILLLALLLIVIGFVSDGGEGAAESIGFVVGLFVGVWMLWGFLKWLFVPKHHT